MTNSRFKYFQPAQSEQYGPGFEPLDYTINRAVSENLWTSVVFFGLWHCLEFRRLRSLAHHVEGISKLEAMGLRESQ